MTDKERIAEALAFCDMAKGKGENQTVPNELLQILASALRAKEEELESAKHSHYWYGTRFATLREWARGLGEESWHEFNCIVANGSKDVGIADIHAQNYNRLEHRAESAEKALAEKSKEYDRNHA